MHFKLSNMFIYVMAFFGTVSFALTGVVKSKAPDLPQKLDVLDATLSSMDPVLVFASLVLFVGIVYLVSMGISIKFFRKRVLF